MMCGLAVALGCGGHGGGGGDGGGTGTPSEATREFRAIAGVSMGAYGAMNIGTKHPETFGTIVSLGGPVDMAQLLRDVVAGVQVRPQTAIPSTIGDPVTFDHPLDYPDRDTRVSMLQDLVLAFGNPLLHHPDPARQYLARDSEPASLLRDDEFGAFTIPDDPRGFLDGGDANQNGLREGSETPTEPTDVLLVANGSLPTTFGLDGALVGGRALADLDGDGVFDVGDGLVINLSEPFTDNNGDLVFDPGAGETFSDVGLDGVSDTGDFGEGNGTFDYDPDRTHWLAEDPLTRLAARPAADIATQRMYMDVGIRDEFGFAQHYANLVAVLQGKGLSVRVKDGFAGNCANLPEFQEQFLLVRYEGGHIGFASVDPKDLIEGDPCGDATVWQRILNMLGYLDDSFPNGFYGSGEDVLPVATAARADRAAVGSRAAIDPPDVDLPDLNPTGDIVHAEIDSPALGANGSVPTRSVLVYRPPAFFHTEEHFPIVYFLGGYGQEPEDYEQIRVLFDTLILTGQLQNMFFAVLPGDGGHEGSFYVDHVVPESQAPDVPEVTSGRYEDSILQDLIPAIERDVAEGRLR